MRLQGKNLTRQLCAVATGCVLGVCWLCWRGFVSVLIACAKWVVEIYNLARMVDGDGNWAIRVNAGWRRGTRASGWCFLIYSLKVFYVAMIGRMTLGLVFSWALVQSV